MSSDLARLNLSVFSQHLHTQFNVSLDSSTTIAIELTTAAERPTAPNYECFSLLFVGPETPYLGQGLRTLEHATLGTMDLFLVPVGKDARGVTYEAVFNRNRAGLKA
jgi:hypothetical protein